MEVSVHYDPALPALGILPEAVRAEVLARVNFCVAALADYGADVPANPQIFVTKVHSDAIPGYVPVVEFAIKEEAYGLAVYFRDDDDPLGGMPPVIRDAFGQLDFWQ